MSGQDTNGCCCEKYEKCRNAVKEKCEDMQPYKQIGSVRTRKNLFPKKTLAMPKFFEGLLNLSLSKIIILLIVFIAISVESAPTKMPGSSRDISAPYNKTSLITSPDADLLDVEPGTQPEAVHVPVIKHKRRARRKHKNKKRKNKRRNKKNKSRRGKNNKNKNRRPSSSASAIFLHRAGPDEIHGTNSKQPKMTSPRRQRLYSKVGNSFHLAVMGDGRVRGERSNLETDNTIVEVKAVRTGVVTMMGVAAKRYICVTKKGKVRAKEKYNKKTCIFKEYVLPNHMNQYESLSCKGCFLHLNKRGKITKLKNGDPNSVATFFLPRRLDFEFKYGRAKRLAEAKRGKVETIDISNSTSPAASNNFPMSPSNLAIHSENVENV